MGEEQLLSERRAVFGDVVALSTIGVCVCVFECVLNLRSHASHSQPNYCRARFECVLICPNTQNAKRRALMRARGARRSVDGGAIFQPISLSFILETDIGY